MLSVLSHTRGRRLFWARIGGSMRGFGINKRFHFLLIPRQIHVDFKVERLTYDIDIII